MNKLDGKSLDIVSENVTKLKELFPEVFSEGKIDFDKLQEELGAFTDKENERYNFTWNGKQEAKRIAQTPSTGTLRPSKEDSKNWDTTQNLYIEGDNLEVLKLLQKSYHKQVKMIYIDPPYNTGKDFVYKDNFKDNIKNYMEQTGQVDSEGNRLSTNSDTNGRYHSDWLSMMYPRLKLARNLLKDDGVIFISIDDSESTNLKNICNEIFGEPNFIITLSWEKGRKNDSTFFSETVEYIHIYAKNKEFLAKQGPWREKKTGLDNVLAKYDELKLKYKDNHIEIESKMKEFYTSMDEKNPDKKLKHFFRSDSTGLYFGADISSASTSIPDYDIIHPITKKAVKKPSRGWGCTEPVMIQRMNDNRVLFGEDESTIPLKKSYLTEVDSIVKTPVIYKDGRAASLVVKQLLQKSVFENPKDHNVLSDLIKYVKTDNEIILDFFSGSATTAHAIIKLNSEDDGNRKYICVQLPEATDEKSEAYKAGYKNICEIGKERIRRAGEKIIANNPDKDLSNLDIGFKVYKLDSSNIKEWDSDFDNLEANLLDSVDNIKSDRTSEDLLYEILLKYGLDLTLPIEEKTIAGKTVYNIGFGALVVCLDDAITIEVVEAIAEFIKEQVVYDEEKKKRHARVVFKDKSFTDTNVKTNAIQVLKQYDIDEVVSI